MTFYVAIGSSVSKSQPFSLPRSLYLMACTTKQWTICRNYYRVEKSFKMIFSQQFMMHIHDVMSSFCIFQHFIFTLNNFYATWSLLSHRWVNRQHITHHWNMVNSRQSLSTYIYTYNEHVQCSIKMNIAINKSILCSKMYFEMKIIGN